MHQPRCLCFLVDDLDEAEASFLVKTSGISRESAGKDQQSARFQKALELGPREQAAATLDSTVLGAVSRNVEQTSTTLKGTDEASLGVVGCQRQSRPTFAEKAVQIGFVVHQVPEDRQIFWVCAWVSMADKHGRIVGDGSCLFRTFQPTVAWCTVDAVLMLAELEDASPQS